MPALSVDMHGPATHPPSHDRPSTKMTLSSFSGLRFAKAFSKFERPQTSMSCICSFIQILKVMLVDGDIMKK